MRRLLTALALAAFIAAGCANTDGSASNSEAKTIDVTMTDSKYEPGTLTVTKGQKITFRFTNNGALVHEALIGNRQDQDDHAKEMMASTTTMDGMHSTMDGDGMSGVHHADTVKMVTVQPKTSKDLTMTFDTAGEYLIGCHQPGHWEAGMKATVTVRD